jgi:excisionase family DNA binding protein
MLDDLPPFLTVEQAAKVLQLGRSKAYELTVEWQCSSGATGLPFVRFGSQKRVPRAALVRLIETALDRPPAA